MVRCAGCGSLYRVHHVALQFTVGVPEPPYAPMTSREPLFVGASALAVLEHSACTGTQDNSMWDDYIGYTHWTLFFTQCIPLTSNSTFA